MFGVRTDARVVAVMDCVGRARTEMLSSAHLLLENLYATMHGSKA